ncbi:hypothetical protein GCS58_25580, partial [Vibrio parahaemolyticus]|nr:hypothetical protein [Vibrio parahaemolyticus]
MIKSYVLAGLVPKFLSLVTFSFIISTLSSEEYVYFDFVMVTYSIIFPAISLCLADSAYHFAIKKGNIEVFKSISSFVNASHLASLFILLFLYAFHMIDVRFLYVLVLSYLYFRLYLTRNKFRVLGESRKFLAIELLPVILVFIACFAISKASIVHSYAHFYIWAYVFCWIVVVLLFSELKKDFFCSFKLKRIYLEFSLPLVPNAMIVLILFNAFRYLDVNDNIQLLYSLNYRLVSFYIIASGILFMIMQDYYYKFSPSLFKYVIAGFFVSIIVTTSVFVFLELVKEYYLGDKSLLVDMEIYKLSVIAMI